MIVNVKVTQALIDTGKRHNSDSCPIANAVRGQCGVQAIRVDEFSISFLVGNEIRDFRHCVLPHSAVTFVAAFDAGEPVQPFEFELEVNE